MADAKFEEVIRLAFETAGTDGIKQAAATIAQMGDVSEQARGQAADLLDTIGQAEKAERAVEQYRSLGLGIIDYQRQITAAKAKVIELAEALKSTDAPTKAQQRELDRARSAVSGLVGQQQKQLAQLRTIKTELEGQGINLRSVAAAQQQVAARTEAASASLRTLATRLRDEHAAQQSFQAQLAAEADKTRTQNAQYQEALRKTEAQIRANGKAAQQAGAEASASMETTRGIVDKLKGALAGVAVYFSAQGILGGIKSMLTTGDQFAKFEKQLGSIYGSATKGSEAFAWVKQFAKDTPLQLDEVMQSFIQLKNFGIDPMSGALQAAVDQNAKLGGESERLARITLAMGQAFSKGKLQGQDIKQMIEAGVPVWQLLGEVTGKTTAELQKMSETGKLTQDVMQKFFAQMGKDSAGAAADQMSSLAGQFSNLQDNIQQFEDRVARKGVLDYFRQQLAALNAWVDKMAADGRLDAYAQRISDAVVRMAEAARTATRFIADHAAAIANLAKVYATFKIARIAGELAIAATKFVDTSLAANAAGAAMGGAAGKAGLLSRALGRIPGSVKIAIAVVGLDLLQKAGKYIGELAGEHSAAARELEKTQHRVRDQMRTQAEAFMAVEQQHARFADTQVKSAAEIAKLSEAERADYAERLKGLQSYLAAKASEQLRLRELGELSQDDLAKTLVALKAARAGTDDLQRGAELASAALKSKLSVDAQSLRDGLHGIGADATTAQARLEELFQTFQADSVTHIGDIALALASVANESQAADRAVRLGLQGTLGQLSSTDLLKFQSAATAAFSQYQVGAKDAAAVTETVLQSALERLGVSADRWGLKTTDAARQNVAAFEVVAENAAATAGAIESAFNRALANATTIEAVQDLGSAMAAAGQQGKVGFDATERAAAAVQNRIRQLRTALDPLADQFAKLGIQSKRALDDAAAAASSSFTAITRAYQGGKASIEDVRAAFAAYSKTQMDAVANSDTWRQAQVRASLDVQAATLGVSSEIGQLGAAGAEAGDKMARGAHTASEALRDTADAARDVRGATDDAVTSAERFGDATRRAGDGARDARRQTDAGAVSLAGYSDALVRAYTALNHLAGTRTWVTRFNEVTAEWQRQNDALNEQLGLLAKQHASYDEMSQRVEKLRGQYGLLNDAQLQSLAAAQKQAEDDKQRAADDAKRKQQDAANARRDRSASDADAFAKFAGQSADAGASASSAPAPAPGVGQHLTIDLNVGHQPAPAGAQPLDMKPTDLQRLANEVVRQIGLAKARMS